jgi:glutaredoxin
VNMSIFRLLCAVVLLSIPLFAQAITVIECVEKDGSSWFRDKCPPEMSVKSSQEVRGKRKPTLTLDKEIASRSAVVLFTAPNCEACDLVREQLSGREVPFTEKDSSQDRGIQAKLSATTGGPLTVPTITISEYQFTGYSHHQLKSALDNAGYP